MAKRINLIVKGKGIVESLLQIREKKVMRAVESAADYAEEQQLDADAASLKALTRIGECADNSEALKAAINLYCEALDEKEAWEKKAKQIATLKKALNEEVVEPDHEA